MKRIIKLGRNYYLKKSKDIYLRFFVFKRKLQRNYFLVMMLKINGASYKI